VIPEAPPPLDIIAEKRNVQINRADGCNADPHAGARSALHYAQGADRRRMGRTAMRRLISSNAATPDPLTGGKK